MWVNPREKKKETLAYYEAHYRRIVKIIRESKHEDFNGELFQTARHYQNMIRKFRKELGYE